MSRLCLREKTSYGALSARKALCPFICGHHAGLEGLCRHRGNAIRNASPARLSPARPPATLTLRPAAALLLVLLPPNLPLPPQPVHWPDAGCITVSNTNPQLPARSGPAPPSRRPPANKMPLSLEAGSNLSSRTEPIEGRDRRSLSRRAGIREAPPRQGSESGGRRARMWRVTLNCSRSQTP